MPLSDDQLKEIVLYLFLHKWLAIPYNEANAALLYDALKVVAEGTNNKQKEN